MYRHSIYQYKSARQRDLFLLSVWLTAFALLLPVWTWAQTPGSSTARALSNTFTEVSRQALPAVVSITVEQTAESKGPLPFTNPFEGFGEEFFERFFRWRLPQGRPPREFRQQGQGSGFIISQDGLILTNHHVAGVADRVTVKLADGREFKAKTIGTDAPSDIAVIKIEGQNLPVLPLGNSDTMEVGDWVIAAGNPFGLTQTITVGVISAKGRSHLGITDFEDFLQTDAAINPGNSGGPLINLRGEAIGVNTAIFSRSGGYMGIGFAIPINMAKAIKDQLVAEGKVMRGYLGVRIQELTKDLAESFNLDTAKGVLVASVSPDSPAARAGLQQGDVIVAFNGTPIEDTGQLRNLVAMTTPGTRVTVQILRKNTQQELTVELGELPVEHTARAGEEMQPPARLGFTVQTLTPELARQLGYEDSEGVVITQVNPSSEAYQAGVRRGMLIHQVNRQDINNTEEFQQALEASEQTKRVLLLVEDQQQATRYITFHLAA